MKQPTSYLPILSILLSSLVEESCAFQAPRPVSSQQETSALRLVPGQGSQLVAAFNAACARDEDDDDDDDDYNEYSYSTTPVVVASKKDIIVEEEQQQQKKKKESNRSLVSRIFSLPSTLIKRHPHPTSEGLNHSLGTKEGGDYVLYPIVGFQFFTDEDGECKVLPTKSNVSCRLNNSKKEELYGWFSPACPLDTFSDDICHEPEEE